MSPLRIMMVLASVIALAGIVDAQLPVDADLIAAEGDAAPGAPGFAFDNLNAPFTNGDGAVGFTGSVTDGVATENFVFVADQIVWLNSDGLPLLLTGAEGTMGISNLGDFIYSPAVDGFDAVYTNNGVLLKEDDPTPGLPGFLSSFNSRPTMVADGTVHWICGFTDTPGGSSQGRILYASTGAGTGTPTIVIKSGDFIGGFEIDSSGVDFDYDFSDDSAHHIHVIDTVGDTTTDGFVYVDGEFVAREGDPTGDGDNWDNFDGVSINTSGDYIFTGDTNGDGATDEFIAYNGSIVLREGDIVGGVPLESSASLRGASINNDGLVAHAWGVSGGAEILFVGEAADLQTTSEVLLTTGDTVDLDGDTLPDATVTDFNASLAIGPGLSFADDGFIHLEVDLEDPVTMDEYEAILRLALPGGPPPVAFVRGECNNDGNSDIADAVFLLGVLFVAPDPIDCLDACDANDDGAIDIADPVAILGALFGAPATPLPAPYPDCGPDVGADTLSCDAYAHCP